MCCILGNCFEIPWIPYLWKSRISHSNIAADHMARPHQHPWNSPNLPKILQYRIARIDITIIPKRVEYQPVLLWHYPCKSRSIGWTTAWLLCYPIFLYTKNTPKVRVIYAPFNSFFKNTFLKHCSKIYPFHKISERTQLWSIVVYCWFNLNIIAPCHNGLIGITWY